MDLRSQELIDLISVKTGLNIKGMDVRQVEKAADVRIKALNLPSPGEYKKLLSSSSIEAKEEWNQLIPYLTKGESFFFRDKGQISLLNNKILPELIKKKRTQRELRVWSAGCSTGEEPYTLAIMLDQLIPNWDDWKVHIVATDITETAVKKARSGLFSDWSFRGVDLKIKKRYFEKHRDKNWKIIDRIRKKVIFSVGNLITDKFPSVLSNINNMDLIVCRNVFIYHKREAVFEVVEKFSQTLVDAGYLLVGHSELYDRGFDKLKMVSSKEGLFYQKTTNAKKSNGSVAPKIDLKNTWPSKKEPHAPKALTNDNGSLKRTSIVKSVFNKKTSDKKIEGKNQSDKKTNPKFEETFLKAQSFANRGDYEQALSYFKKAEVFDPFRADLFYFWAHLELDRKNFEEAKAYFKKAIYLEASFVPAYFDLINIYEMDKDEARANKMKQTTLKLLNNMRPDDKIEFLQNAKVSELVQYLKE